MEEKEFDQEKLEDIVADVTADASKEMAESVGVLAGKIVQEGMLPRDALGLTDEMVEGLYGQAYRLFNNGKYEEAAMLFRLLIMLDFSESKYHFGLASSVHMKGDYSMAAQLYLLAAISDRGNPTPYYHASDCFLNVDDKGAAYGALIKAIEDASDKPEYQMLKDRCQMSVEALKKELIEEGIMDKNGEFIEAEEEK